jgi:hypothetical protein
VKDLRDRSWSTTIGLRDRESAAIIPLPTELSRRVEDNTQASFTAAGASETLGLEGLGDMVEARPSRPSRARRRGVPSPRRRGRREVENQDI